MTTYDLIVIGAGPSGAAAALGAIAHGLRVLVLEQHHFPRRKACTGCLSNKSLLRMNELGLELPSSMVRGRITGVTLRSSRSSQRSSSGSKAIGVMVDRPVLDQWLMEQAQERGAEFRDGEPIRGLQQDRELATVCTEHGCYAGRWIVGADGVGGPTANMAGIRRRWRRWELGCTWSITLPYRLATSQAILTLCDIPTAWGWVFPREDGLHLGVGGSQLFGDALRRRFDGWLDTYARDLGTTANQHRPIRYSVPAGGFRRRVAESRVILAGDAAGLVDPFSGEGIHLALASGHAAAEAIVGGWNGSAVSAYQQWVDQLLPELRLSLWLSLALGGRGPLVARALCRSNWAAEALSSWMAGESSYRQLIKESLVPSP